MTSNTQKKIILCFSLIVLTFVLSPDAFAQDFYITQDGAGSGNGSSIGNAMSAASFNGLSGDKGGNTYFFSGTFATRITVTKAHGNASAPMMLDGYAVGNIDALKTTGNNAALLGSGFEIEDMDYITIQDFRMTSPDGDAVIEIFDPEDANPSTHILFQRIYGYDAYGQMVQVNGPSPTLRHSHIVFDKCRFLNFQKGGVTSKMFNWIHTTNFAFTNSIIGNVNPSTGSGANIFELHACQYGLFEYNDISGAPDQGGISIKEDSSATTHGNQDIIVRFNHLHHNGSINNGSSKGLAIGWFSNRVYAYGNYIHHNGVGGIDIKYGADNVYVWSNVIDYSLYYGIVSGRKIDTQPTQPACDNIYIYNNTLSRSGYAATTSADPSQTGILANDPGSTNLNFKNNILFNSRPNSTYRQAFYIRSGLSGDITSEHNLIYHSTGSGTDNYWYYVDGYKNLSTMQGLRLEDNAPATIIANPLFVGPLNGDFRLGASSPAIGSGADLTASYSVNLSQGDAWFKSVTGYSTILMSTRTALSPRTNWTVQPSPASILTADRSLVGWDRGAYSYAGDMPTYTLGDLNYDGKVDIADYSMFIQDFGKTGANLPADLNKNGQVEIGDYSIFISNFGKTG